MLEHIKKSSLKLDYPAPKCLDCQGQMARIWLQKNLKFLSRSVRSTKLLFDWENAAFVVTYAEKMAVAETSLVQKNHQISTIVNQKITQKLIEKVSMTAITRNFIGLYFDSHP